MRSRSQTPGNGSETVRSVRQVFPEFLHAGEEAGGFGGGVATFAGRLELAQQFPLLLGEVDRRLDGDLDVHVAERLGAQHRHALALEAELLVRRSEEHTSELQSLMRISYAVFCLKKKKHQ